MVIVVPAGTLPELPEAPPPEPEPEPEPEPTPTPDPESGDVTPRKGVGKSGGGCDSGLSFMGAFALAVFMLRKKNS